MSCSFCSHDDFNMLKVDVGEKPHKKSSESHHSKYKKLKQKMTPGVIAATTTKFMDLPRGGSIVFTRIGPIQFGIPPESVKDALTLGIEVPTYYIIPTSKWDKVYNVSLAEFEFPAYFNFFIKKRKISLICTSENEKAIKAIFQETLLGPTSFPDFTEDFSDEFDEKARPDMAKELSYFAKNPFNPKEPLQISTLIDFVNIDDNGILYQYF